MRNVLAAVIAVAALTMSAQEPEKPDYSREAALKAFYIPPIELGPKPKGRVQFKFGAIEFRALGMDWRILYLPLAAPLSGTRMGVTNELPNPFELTGVSLPGKATQELEPQSREMRAELRRIRRVTR